MKDGLLFMNIQETDLAGHAEDPVRYAEVLETADKRLTDVLPLYTGDDILIVMADHGDDPTIGFILHTRERTPLLIYKEGTHNKYVGERSTLSDVGATGSDYFDVQFPENGEELLASHNRWNGFRRLVMSVANAGLVRSPFAIFICLDENVDNYCRIK